jgi:hypothetical protein
MCIIAAKQQAVIIYIGRYRTVSKYLKQNHSGLSNKYLQVLDG